MTRNKSICALAGLLFCSAVYAEFKTIPIGYESARYTAEIPNLPTGSREFEVEQPKPKSDLILNAADFGLDEKATNAATILNAAIEECRKRGAAKLVVNKGVYKAFEDVSIKIDGLKDFTIDGNGATLVFKKTWKNNFDISNCERFKLANLNIDWDWASDPLASLVEVVGKNIDKDENTYVDFKFVDYADFPNKNANMVCTSPYDVKADCVGSDGGFHEWFDNPWGASVRGKIEWIKPNIARVYHNPKAQWSGKDPRGKNAYKVGMKLRMQHYYYHMNNMHIRDNLHTTFENVNVYSCAGHSFVLGGKRQKYLLFKNVNIRRPDDGIHRVITCTADHFHVMNSGGFIKFLNCEFGLGADDCVNVHDVARYIRRKSDFSVFGTGYGEVGDRIEFRNPDYSPAGLTAKIVKIVRDPNKKGSCEIFFDQKLPEGKAFILFNREYSSTNMILENCKFWGNRARGVILQSSDITIKKCRFYHNESSGLRVNTGYAPGLWTEGYGAKNIVVKDCVFKAVCATPSRGSAGKDDSAIACYVYEKPTKYPILRDILIENCKFIDTHARALTLSSCANVIFRNNSFKEKTEVRRAPNPERSQIFIEYSRDIKIINNTFRESDMANPAVNVDTATTSDIVVEGNRLKTRGIVEKLFE